MTLLDDDYDTDNTPVSSDSKFFDKLIFNAVTSMRKSSVNDDMFFSYLVDHTSVLTGNWRKIYRSRHKEYTESQQEQQTRFIMPSSLLSAHDYAQMFDEIRVECPWVNEDFRITNNAKQLRDLLDIDTTEALILNIALAMPDLDYYYRAVLDRLMFDDEMRHPAKLYSRILGLPENDVKKSLEGFLLQSGFVVPSEGSPKTLLTIDAIFEDCFTNPNLTRESIESFLFPSNITTDLQVDDYNHIAKEVAIAESVLSKGLARETKGINLMLWGIPGTGKTELAVALAKKHGWNLKIIGDMSDRDSAEKSRTQRITSLRVAMKLYSRSENTVLLFDEMEDLFRGQKNETFSKAFVNRIIETTQTPIIWTTNDLETLGSAVLRRMVYNIHLDVPPESSRLTIWKNYNTKYDLKLDDATLAHFAEHYDIVPSLINNAAKISGMAGLPANQIPDVLSSLDTLVNYGVKREFNKIARAKCDDSYDLTCANTDVNLARISDQLVRAKSRWSMCLYGAPGTGKSEYGKYVSKLIGKKVLLRRASDILGMFVGENEKNIAKAFKDARDNGQVLLIDEGDTFIRSRQLAKQSWEASMTNEMLTQMESHDQPFILTTNLMDDVDEAALRRFTFKVKFGFMKPEQAARLFRRFFGVDAPKAIATNHLLAPGDFANVKQQADILGITDAEALYAMLESECALKPQKGRNIGFMS